MEDNNQNGAGPDDQKDLNAGGAGAGDNTGTGAAPAAAVVPGPLDKKEEKKDEKKKGKTVEVDADVLDRILKTVESQGEKIKILTEVADKNRLTRVEEMRAQGKLVKKVKLNTYEGKIIIGWKKIKDDVWIDQEGRLHEDQIVGLVFEGEKEVGKELDVRSFSRLIVKVPVEVLEESKDRDGNTNFLVRTEDGREIKIDSNFIN